MISKSTPPPAHGAPLLAIEIGGTKLQLAVGRDDGTIIDRVRFHIEREAGAKGIRAQIEAALPGLLKQHRLRAVGVGYGGPVDWRSGKIWRSYHIEGWSDFPLGEWLSGLTKLPVFVDNDGNVAALGEAHHGAGVGKSPVMYVTLGSGVGAGLTIGGSIYHGDLPGELELGHVRLNESGLTVQQRCSGWAVDAIVREAVVSEPRSVLALLVEEGKGKGTGDRGQGTGGEARFLGPAMEQSCKLATRIVRETMRQLAFALSHATHLIHPQTIIIGGGLSQIGEPLRAALAEELKGFLMDAFAPGPVIALAALKEDAVPVGALVLAGRGASA